MANILTSYININHINHINQYFIMFNSWSVYNHCYFSDCSKALKALSK